jgi:hypothetical protein
MAYGIKPFRRIQISNVEGTPFTAEAATEILFGEITIHSSDAIYHTPDQDRGTLAKIVELPFMTAKDVELEFTGSLYDRLMIFICSNSIRGNVTPSNGGGSVPLQETWVFEPGLTTLNTPDIANGIDTFTVEFGDNVQEGEMAGMVTTKWEIEGEVGAEEDAIVTVIRKSWKAPSQRRSLTRLGVTSLPTLPSSTWMRLMPILAIHRKQAF